jgi:hypothetical protein
MLPAWKALGFLKKLKINNSLISIYKNGGGGGNRTPVGVGRSWVCQAYAWQVLRLVQMVLILFLLFSLRSSAHAWEIEPWSKTDIALEAVCLGLIMVDWGQTLNSADNTERYKEHNPALGNHPSRGRVNTIIPLSMIAHAGIAHVLPGKWRKAWIVSTIAVEIRAVRQNHSVGLKVTF